MTEKKPHTAVERLTIFHGTDLEDLCHATEAAIVGGGGFGWVKVPPRQILETYWRGVLLVPERHLFVGRLDGTIAGSAQLTKMPRNNEAQAWAAHLTAAFVAPWARGYGLARGLVASVEEAAKSAGISVLNLDIRETQTAAIQLYEQLGYVRWGTHPEYACVNNDVIPGLFYYKRLGGRA
jgi:ribosomal protein S18 acetylase RimI-like enzyme